MSAILQRTLTRASVDIPRRWTIAHTGRLPFSKRLLRIPTVSDILDGSVYAADASVESGHPQKLSFELRQDLVINSLGSD